MPGDSEKKLTREWNTGADARILDLKVENLAGMKIRIRGVRPSRADLRQAALPILI